MCHQWRKRPLNIISSQNGIAKVIKHRIFCLFLQLKKFWRKKSLHFWSSLSLLSILWQRNSFHEKIKISCEYSTWLSYLFYNFWCEWKFSVKIAVFCMQIINLNIENIRILAIHFVFSEKLKKVKNMVL